MFHKFATFIYCEILWNILSDLTSQSWNKCSTKSENQKMFLNFVPHKIQILTEHRKIQRIRGTFVPRFQNLSNNTLYVSHSFFYKTVYEEWSKQSQGKHVNKIGPYFFKSGFFIVCTHTYRTATFAAKLKTIYVSCGENFYTKYNL